MQELCALFGARLTWRRREGRQRSRGLKRAPACPGTLPAGVSHAVSALGTYTSGLQIDFGQFRKELDVASAQVRSMKTGKKKAA
jgi:hypothetical protein